MIPNNMDQDDDSVTVESTSSATTNILLRYTEYFGAQTVCRVRPTRVEIKLCLWILTSTPLPELQQLSGI